MNGNHSTAIDSTIDWFSKTICDTPFWDHNLSWNSTSPTLTSCFNDTGLVWPPVFFLWFSFPFMLYDYLYTEWHQFNWNRYNIVKLILTVILFIIGLIHAIYTLTLWTSFDEQKQENESSSLITPSYIIALWLNVMTYFLVIIYVHMQRRFGFINGGVLWFYLLMSVFFNTISISVTHSYRPLKLIIFTYLQYSIQILLLILCSFADFNDHRKIHQTLKHCPKDKASIPSRLIFWWFNSFIRLGYRRPITFDDLWQIRPQDSSEIIFKKFNTYWCHSMFSDLKTNSDKKRNPSYNTFQKIKEDSFKNQCKPDANIWKILSQMFWRYFLFPSGGRLFSELLQLVNPIILKCMIDFITDRKAPLWHGIFYSLLLFLTNVIQSLTAAYQQHRFAVLAMRIRSCLIGAIYRKSLVISMESKKDYTTGDIINLMAVDCQRFVDLSQWVCYLWCAPIQIIIGFYLLWRELGPSVIGGFILMVAFIPFSGFISSRIKSLQYKQMSFKDKRLKTLTEMLNGIKVLKLYAWEEAFIKNVNKIRDTELKFIRRFGLANTVLVTINACTPFMVTCMVFTIYVLSGTGNLTPQKAFVAIALFNMLRVSFVMLPNMLTSLILTMVSVRRIKKFLNSDEVDDYVCRQMMDNDAITVSNASFSWQRNVDNGRLTLKNISAKIPKGMLVAIVGPVGSGKSSFLSALMGEMEKHHGKVQISGDLRMAYVAQQAWIQNATVRDNILFGSQFDQKIYDQILSSCALKLDLKMLASGDKTEIGEKGINLSGGQKQRISIARACYSNADLYLLDDPLSAVDSHVSKHIFEKVLHSEQGILRNKTRILVTNALYVLPSVDQIILINNGKIEATGTYQELLKKNDSFKELIENYSQTNANDLNLKPMIECSDEQQLAKSADSVSFCSARSESFSQRSRRNTRTSMNITQNVSKLIEEENIETGKVSWNEYKKFLSALSFWLMLTFMMNIGTVSSNAGSNFWLASWTNLVQQNKTIDNVSYLSVYFTIGALQMIFVAFSYAFIVLGCIRASKTLHRALLNSIVHAPMSFFDTTPLGRIMNRFSKDIDVLDNYLQNILRVCLNHSLQIVATMFIISYQTPLFLTIVIPFALLYYFIQRFFVSTSRQLKRLESVSRSPIFIHLHETINGVSTIKVFGAAQRFIRELNKRLDDNQRAFYPSCVAYCWLQVRLEFLANCLIFFSAFVATLTKWMADDNEHGLTGGQIGLSLSYAMNTTISLNWVIRTFAELENHVVSVERISEYTGIESEAPWYSQHDKNVSSNWPDKGQIQFTKYETRYREGLDLVLKGVNLSIGHGEKIGIVGRTGAGKSSLALALFRIIEANHGHISIDNVVISNLGLHKLRSRLTIIPQDPVLFQGTIRFNLDPFNEHSDDELWQVLELSHLKSFVLSLESGLEYQVTESGENLSIGQRQLFCLARALLRRTNVLVLDEATAAVDMETDSLIQTTIRKEFAKCTILTIAHRLNTILDSDKILVLDCGRVVEFDTPRSLLQNQSTIFYSLAKDANLI